MRSPAGAWETGGKGGSSPGRAEGPDCRVWKVKDSPFLPAIKSPRSGTQEVPNNSVRASSPNQCLFMLHGANEWRQEKPDHGTPLGKLSESS